MAGRLETAQKRLSYLFGTLHGTGAPEVICERGDGVYLYDQNGNKYIDLSGGPPVVSLGHASQKVNEATKRQIDKVSFFFRAFWLNEPLLELAERIITVSPANLTMCQFCNSGSEANETAIKIAHQYHVERGKPEKYMVLSRWQSYHGMTLGALSVSGHTIRRQKFAQILHHWPKIPAPLCYHCAYELTYPGCDIKCARALEELINQVGPQYVAAFFIEPVGGAGTACMVPVPEYYPMVREICDKYDVLLIDDEVICGFGRTGKWFGIEHWGVSPDILTSAKGMTGGYTPMAVVIIDQKIGKVFKEKSAGFMHGFTMEGNPVSAATCLAVINVLEKEGLVARCAKMGEYFFQKARARLSHHPVVGDIRGKGLLMGIELVQDKAKRQPFALKRGAANRLQRIAMEHGVMGYPTVGIKDGVSGDAFLVSPPFIITEPVIDEAFDRIDAALTAFEKEFL